MTQLALPTPPLCPSCPGSVGGVQRQLVIRGLGPSCGIGTHPGLTESQWCWPRVAVTVCWPRGDLNSGNPGVDTCEGLPNIMYIRHLLCVGPQARGGQTPQSKEA